MLTDVNHVDFTTILLEWQLFTIQTQGEIMENLEVLTLQEAALYLKISERTVYDWAQKGKIPCGKLGASWRFIKKDLEEWVMKNLSQPQTKSTLDSISQILKPSEIYFVDVEEKVEVFDFLIEKMSKHDAVKDKSELRQAIYDREELMSTGIGLGIGVPHVRINSIKDITMCVAINKNGFKGYESLDSEPVKIVFMIGANQDQHVQYIKLLSQLSKKIKSEGVSDQLLSTNDPKTIISLILLSITSSRIIPFVF